jgi:SPX domain protein involved in polyphosphate accumulation
LYKDLADDDWTSAARGESPKQFPHAILEIRREGNQAMALIQTLDRSHLVGRLQNHTRSVR